MSTNEPPLGPTADEPRGSLGAHLAKARKTRGWTLGYAASQLRVPESTVELLESDDYSRFPAEVYVKGYLRNYARLLRLPPEDIVQAYVEQRGGVQPFADTPHRSSLAIAEPAFGRRPVSAVHPTQHRRGVYRQQPAAPAPARSALLWVAAALLLGYLSTWLLPEGNGPGIAAWLAELRSAVTFSPVAGTNQAVADNGTDTEPAEISLPHAEPAGATAATEGFSANPQAVVESSAGSDSAPETATRDGAHLDTLILRFEEDSWATVIDADGKRLLHQTGEKGATKTITGRAPFNLTVGRIGNVAMEFNGHPIEFPNAKNRATERFSIPLKSVD